MIFFSDPNDIYHSQMMNLSRFDDQRRGILVQIHDPNTEVSLDQSSSITISPGYLTEIVIKRVTTSRKKHPFPSKCHTSKTTKYKLIGGRYTRSNCISSCFQLKLQEECGDIMKPNKSATQILCESDMYRRQPIEDCQCPQPCYEVAFPRIVSISVWPRMFQFESLIDDFSKMANTSDNMTLQYMQKRFSQVKIYYQDLLETKLSEEELYGITNLLSEVGGLMGLLIGSSVISVVEIIWLSGIIIKKLFRSAFSQTEKELKEISTIKNSDIVVYNRTDHLVNATGLVDYKELIDSPGLAYSRRLEQTV
ncbi:degenerin unc-8-like [Rhopilema esculentum]|uniref:degenerin unc-8-like n=1 Tax=Rhopilema esculentum TaxID=499914 RepID=UPI0031D129AA